jgi:hypothetical protein
MDRVCKQCGVDISHMGPRALFCKKVCGKASRKGLGHIASKKCRVCLKEFIASGRSHRRVVCSDECWKAWDRMIKANCCEFSISLIGPIKPRKCLVCHGEFISMNGREGYCSTPCKSKADRGRNGEYYSIKNREWRNNQSAAASTLSLAYTISQIKGDLTNGTHEPE